VVVQRFVVSAPSARERRPALDTKGDFELTFYITTRASRAFVVEFAVSGLPPAKGGHQSPVHIDNKHVDRARLLLESLANALPKDFVPLRCAVALELTLHSPLRCPPGDALNFLGGVGDVLQRKIPDIAGHLGPLADVVLYHDDRQIRRVRFDQRTAAELGYVVCVRAIGQAPLGIDHLPRRRSPTVDAGRPVRGTAELAVAFANSTDMELREYASFVEWCLLKRIVNHEVAATLRRVAARMPTDAAELMLRVREFRQAIRSLLSGEVVDPDGLMPITQARRRCGTHEVVELVGTVLTVRCAAPVNDIGLPLCAIWRSAVGLLESDAHTRVRRCASERCGKLFIDKSRNHTRRWCDMNDCGNAAKVRRYRQRQRAPKARTAR
jgi:predicted RNA-binding Zn ribbon-like protein